MIKTIRGFLAGTPLVLAIAGCGLVSLGQPGSPDLAKTDPVAGAPKQLDGDPQVVYIQATDKGFQPAVVSIPQGMRVRVVLTNSDKTEHHFHVAGMRASEAKWLAKASDGTTSFVDEHPCNHYCPSGICYTKNTLHAYVAPGGSDEVMFVPADKGEFIADDPLSDLKATIRVF